MILNTILTSEYTFWWLLPIAIIALALSYFLYRKDHYLNETSKYLKWFLFSIRFISIFLIAFLLLKPLITHIKRDFFKAHLLILQDNSQSLLLNHDSLSFTESYQQSFKTLEGLLEKEDIDYTSYAFSDSLVQTDNFSFNQKVTNISQALDQAINLNLKDNVAGLLVLTDGIYNKGRDPFYLSKTSQIPIFTVGLGDESIKVDLKINQIDLNKLGFTKQNIPFSIDIKSEGAIDETFQFKIKEGQNVLFEQSFSIQEKSFFKNINNTIQHLETGLHALKFELSRLSNELNIKNNSQTLYINIIESKQKILMLYSAPHPDIAALKAVLKKQENYELESYSIRDFKENIAQYNLVILHQLPDTRNPIPELIQKLNNNEIPVLNIVSDRSLLKQLNTIASDITYSTVLNKNEWTQLSTNNDFSLFSISPELKEFISNAPPIIAPMLKRNSLVETQTLAYQKIRGFKMDESAVFFTETNNTKYGYILGEGLWQWKLYNYQSEQNFNLFSDLISKIVQYLSIKIPKESFLVDIKNQFQEYEPIKISAQLYNNSLESITNSEVFMNYTDENGKEYEHAFNVQNSFYALNLGYLKPGIFEYEIYTSIQDKKITKSGRFMVLPSLLEYKKTTANHQLLRSISENTQAHFFEKDQWIQLVDSIKNHPKFLSKSFSTEELSDLIDLKWILLLFVFLLSTEWFIRKYSGTI